MPKTLLLRIQAGLPDVEEDSRTSKAEDGGDPPPAEGAVPQPRSTPRAARVAELVNSACRYAEMVKLLCREQGGAVQTDCLHTLLQTLQWQLALALVSCPSPSQCPPAGWNQPAWVISAGCFIFCMKHVIQAESCAYKLLGACMEFGQVAGNAWCSCACTACDNA